MIYEWLLKQERKLIEYRNIVLHHNYFLRAMGKKCIVDLQMSQQVKL